MKKTYTPDYIVINPITGETEQFPNGFTLFTREKEQIEYKDELVSKYGNFVWVLFTREEPFLNKISTYSLAKLFYLATYMTYDNSLAVTSVSGRKKYLGYTDMKRELGLSENTFYRFYREVKDFGMLEKKDGKYYLNSQYFRKGKLGFKLTSGKTDICAFRIFLPAMRSLYANIENHMYDYIIGYLIRMLPNVNRKYNILCDDPLERCARFVDPIPFAHIAEKVGYDPNNARHLVRRIAKMTFFTKGDIENYPIVKVKAGATKWRVRKYLFVNPYLFYGGSDINDVSNFGQDLKV